MATCAPVLDAGRFARAFPFHLWLDHELRVIGAGASLRKALPALQLGLRLHEAFIVTRPREAVTAADWQRHGADLCTLRSKLPGPPLALRGNAELLEDDSLLLLITPVMTSMEALRDCQLGFNDFAKHDAIGEMLLVTRSLQMSADDTHRMADRLRKRSDQLNAILELNHCGVLSVDEEGQVQHVNAALLEMLDVPRTELAGMTLPQVQALLDERTAPDQRGLVQLAHARSDADLQDHRTLHLSVPRPRVIELRNRRSPDGSRFYYLRDKTAEFEVDRMKSDFLTTAAHELRTPMVSVFGFTELLLNRPVGDERRRDVLETIHRQAALLIAMINDLLDLARIESRQGTDLRRVPVPIGRLVQDTLERLGGAAAGHTLINALDAGQAGLALLVDAEKTSQALTNVLSNAIKYSPAGSQVWVELCTAPGQHEAHRVGLRVRDEGVGMSPAQLARVFERFYRADPSGHIPGTGLGMNLVKELVELQEGQVEIRSEAGVGTVVTLWLPLAAPTERLAGTAGGGTRAAARVTPAHAVALQNRCQNTDEETP
ncbi:MAG: hypothetical protein DI603_07340 [Roseateles depolymerans]|uniref:Histidine kinase n=1 Tax=Roseateles depolymerans TaxID=76731 RepID=A0A2W5DXG9_9BURK|nr:MAG: hypothetical protein DI603_07340 [Roseateles depolymerans]